MPEIDNKNNKNQNDALYVCENCMNKINPNSSNKNTPNSINLNNIKDNKTLKSYEYYQGDDDRYDPINAKLEILFESDIFFGRMRNEGVLVVEINSAYKPLRDYNARRSVIINDATINNAATNNVEITAATVEKATINQENSQVQEDINV